MLVGALRCYCEIHRPLSNKNILNLLLNIREKYCTPFFWEAKNLSNLQSANIVNASKSKGSCAHYSAFGFVFFLTGVMFISSLF